MCFFTPGRPCRSFACLSAASQLVPPSGSPFTALLISEAFVVNGCLREAFVLNVTTAIRTGRSFDKSELSVVSNLLASALAASCALLSRSPFILPDLSMTSTMSAGVAVVTVDEVLSPDAVRYSVYSSPFPPSVFTMLLLFDGFTLEFTMVT